LKVILNQGDSHRLTYSYRCISRATHSSGQHKLQEWL
jgi:hypothetical protein